MSDFWKKKKVLVTGAGGFIGSHLAELLVKKGARVTAAVYKGSKRANLDNLEQASKKIKIIETDLTRLDDCLKVAQGQVIIFNLAAQDGSVSFKKQHPAFIFRQNLLINLNMLEAAHKVGAKRFLVMSSAEVYPPEAVVPILESEGFVGTPVKATEGYAWSKRMSEFAAQTFSQEYGLEIAIARPSNVYGPRDYFEGPKCRAIPVFIREAFSNTGSSIVLWGTGEQSRSFLYVEDLVRGLIDLVEKYPNCDPVNLGGVEEITIKDLAHLIVKLSEKDVKIECDLSKPTGSPRRVCSVEKAKETIGFKPSVSLEQGIKQTIDFYKSRYLKT